jgi:outer membrane lipoprotein-sorting protein
MTMNDQQVDRLLTKALGSRRPQPNFEAWLAHHAESLSHGYRSAAAGYIVRAVTTLAACAVLMIGAWWLTSAVGPQEAFAAALDHVKQARTFACTWTIEFIQDGKKMRGVQEHYFKEPDKERRVWVESLYPAIFRNETTISRFGERKQLHYLEVNGDKEASIHDMSSDYVVDPETGNLRLTQLDVSSRDSLLALARGDAVKDLGRVELDKRRVRLLQSQKDDSTIRLWIDPGTELPVQIEIRTPTARQLVTSITIDQPLDESLFSLTPPMGYKIKELKLWDDHAGKIGAKMRYLSQLLFAFAQNSADGRFPKALKELETMGVKPQVLATVLAPADDPKGVPVIRYRPPSVALRELKNTERVVLLHEAFDQWPANGVPTMFTDGGWRVVETREEFDQLVK